MPKKAKVGKAQMLHHNYKQRYHDLEEGHRWFNTRRDIIARLMSDCQKNARILELGCSGGMLIKELNFESHKT